MGILKSLFTLGKSFISQAEESIEETQGAERSPHNFPKA